MDNLKNIFVFNKRERVGLIFLSFLSLLLYVFKSQASQIIYPKVEYHNALLNIQFESPVLFEEEKDSVRLIDFDPNKVTENDLQSLGLDNYARKSWMGFLNKGYTFWKIEDVKKIYGLKEEDYERLKPFIKIQKVGNTKKSKFSKSKSKNIYKNKTDTKTSKKPVIIDINTANEEQLKQLRGIGPKRAKTIIKFRSILGGFHSIEQIGEVYGIDSTLFSQLKPFLKLDPSNFKRYNIFELSADSLQVHKFINYRAAHAIKRYLRNNPELQLVDPQILRTLDGVDSTYLDKAIPYLVLRKY